MSEISVNINRDKRQIDLFTYVISKCTTKQNS